jgi:HEAT repeat protein
MPGLQSPNADSIGRAKDLQAAGIADDASLLAFLRSRTLDEAGLSKLQQLVKDLGDRSFTVREAASKGLFVLGKPAAPYLERAQRSPDPEVARRAEECLRRVNDRDGRPGLAGLVAQQIGSRKPKGAAQVLLAYLPFADNEGVAQDVLHALAAVAVVEGTPDATLVKALSAKLPERRAAAAQALAGVHEKTTHAKVLELLKDKEPSVRLRTALALVQNNDADGIPALIELLDQLSPKQILVAEDALIRVAGDGAPIISPGSDAGAVRRCQQAWMRWWAGQRQPFDMKTVGAKSAPRGFTTIVMLDAGRVLELDKQDKVRLKFEGLNYPLDVQMLPGDRLLAAEYHGDRVTERDSAGKIVWEFHLEKPLMAQRLPNGYTFMANEQQFLEVDREGKEIWSMRRPIGERIMKARKMPNGDVAFITTGRYYLRLDSQGRELAGFPVNMATSGGRLDVLPNGHVLVPIKESDRVVEFDSNGRIVWQAQFNKPVAAVRLSNGNTLMTSYDESRAAEIDPSGKEVWQYNAGLRVTRAFRR